MSLLKDRAIAQYKFDQAVKNFLELSDWDNKYHPLPYKRLLKSDRYIRLCKFRAKRAKNNLQAIERKLKKVSNHAISPSLELVAKLMVIFKPELKKEIESIVTFT